jgi:iron complex outermembrane receptor protein
VTAYVEHLTLPARQWRNRLQLLYSGKRDRSFKKFVSGEDSNGDPFPVDDFAAVDAYSSIKFGRGTLEVGIENLFNKQYFLPVHQVQFLNTFRYPSAGTLLSLKYSITY